MLKLVKKGNFMKKLFINLLLILGVHFSLNASSERELIYQDECDKAEPNQTIINPVPFDRSNKPFTFDGSREDLTEYWVIDGNRVTNVEQANNRASGPTFCFFNTRFLRGGKKYKKPNGLNRILSRNSVCVVIGHTKYNLNPKDPEYEARRAEAMSYQKRVAEYDQLTEDERLKERQKNLGNKHDRSKTSTPLDPNSSKQ